MLVISGPALACAARDPVESYKARLSKIWAAHTPALKRLVKEYDAAERAKQPARVLDSFASFLLLTRQLHRSLYAVKTPVAARAPMEAISNLTRHYDALVTAPLVVHRYYGGAAPLRGTQFIGGHRMFTSGAARLI